MERLLRLLVSRPVGTVLALLAVAGLGLLSLHRLPVAAMPAVARPTVRVQATVPGIGMERLEGDLASKLEQRLLVLGGADTVTTWCRDGELVAEIAFSWGVQAEQARLRVAEAVDGLGSAELPATWQVTTTPASERPAVQLVVEGGQALTARTALAEDVLLPALLAIPGVAKVVVQGGARLRTVVRPDPELLMAAGVSPGELRSLLVTRLQQRHLGQVDLEGRAVEVVAAGVGTSPADVAAMTLHRSTGGAITLDELASVRQEQWSDHGVLWVAGTPAVGLALWLAPEANALLVDRQLTSRLENLQQRLPIGIELTRTADTLAQLRQALWGLGAATVTGALVAGLVLALFIRRPAPLALLLLVIPLSLVAAFPVLELLGLGLNLISLAGMALAAGMLVDAAVVVLESCLQPARHGAAAGPRRAITGTARVARAIIASAITTVVVLVPALTLRHLAATLFRQLALAVMITLLTSLVLALLVLPVAAARLAPSRAAREGPLRRWYRRLLSTALARPGWAVPLVLLVLLLSLLVGGGLPQQLLAPEAATAAEIRFVLPTMLDGGDALPVLGGVLAPLRRPGEHDLLLLSPRAGNGPPLPGGSWWLPEARAGSALRLLQDALRATTPGLVVRRAGPAGSLLEALPLRPLTVEIRGRQRRQVQQAAEVVARSLHRSGLPVLTDLPPEVETVQLRPTALGQRLGPALARALSDALPAAEPPGLGVVRLDEVLLGRHDLDGLPVLAGNGISYPLGALAEVELRQQPSLLARRDGQPASCLVVGDATDSVTAVERQLRQTLLATPMSGVTVTTGGGARDWQQARSELVLAAVLGLTLVVLVLAAIYESLLLPMAVLAVLPFAALGGLTAQRWAGGGLDLGSGLAMVLLIGLSVNNGVLLLDRLRDCPGGPARWAHRAASRLRPVLITTLTTVATMAPVAMAGGAGASLRATLARTTLAGLLLSTPAALLVLPPLARLLRGTGRTGRSA